MGSGAQPGLCPRYIQGKESSWAQVTEECDGGGWKGVQGSVIAWPGEQAGGGNLVLSVLGCQWWVFLCGFSFEDNVE